MPIKAMPIQNVTSLAQELSETEGNAARCLEFALLTAAKPGEAVALRWEQVSLEQKFWTQTFWRRRCVEVRRPLSSAAVRLLLQQPRTSDLVFPNPRGGSLTPMTLLAVMKKVAGSEAMTASLRHAFAVWACVHTEYPNDVVRTAMGLAPQDVYPKVEHFAKPKRLMEGRKLLDHWAEQLSAVHA